MLSILITGFFAQNTAVFAAEMNEPIEENSAESEEILEEEVAETDQNFDGEYLKVTEENGILTILDKETGEQIELDIQNEDQAVITDSNGETQELNRDSKGNVYVDGKLEVETPISTEGTYDEVGIENPKARAASKWIYFQTTYTTSQTKGNLQNLALGLFTLMPYVGLIGTFYGIIDAARNIGAPMLYIKVKQYHTKGYQFYRYESFFYSNSARTKLVKKLVNEKRMW